MFIILYMIMIIFIREKNTLQIMAKNKQQSSNLRLPVGSYKNLFGRWKMYIDNHGWCLYITILNTKPRRLTIFAVYIYVNIYYISIYILQTVSFTDVLQPVALSNAVFEMQYLKYIYVYSNSTAMFNINL